MPFIYDEEDDITRAIEEAQARRRSSETGFSRMNLRPLETAADVTAAVATLGASVLLKKLFRF